MTRIATTFISVIMIETTYEELKSKDFCFCFTKAYKKSDQKYKSINCFKVIFTSQPSLNALGYGRAHGMMGKR